MEGFAYLIKGFLICAGGCVVFFGIGYFTARGWMRGVNQEGRPTIKIDWKDLNVIVHPAREEE